MEVVMSNQELVTIHFRNNLNNLKIFKAAANWHSLKLTKQIVKASTSNVLILLFLYSCTGISFSTKRMIPKKKTGFPQQT